MTEWLAEWLRSEHLYSGIGADAAIRHALIDDAAVSIESSEPGRWYPFAALCEVLLWQGRYVDAAELAERTITAYRDDTAVAWPLVGEDTPFRDALLAERFLVPGLADPARLGRVRSGLVPTSVLAEAVTFVDEALRSKRFAPSQLLSGDEDWDEVEQGLRPPFDALAERIGSLSRAETDRLWWAAHTAHNVTVAQRLAAVDGVNTPLWNIRAWFAGVRVRAGDVRGAQATLRAAASVWAPFAMWTLIPVSPVLQESLLPAATAEFRADFLDGVSAEFTWRKKGRKQR